MTTYIPINQSEMRQLLAQRFTSPGYKNWEKVPSVTTGGKPYFYVRFAPSCIDGRTRKQVIVWNRQLCEWTFGHDAQ